MYISLNFHFMLAVEKEWTIKDDNQFSFRWKNTYSSNEDD